MSLTDELETDVHKFVIETGMSETALGVRALNDGSAIQRLRAGKTMTLRRADKLRAFMAAERRRRGLERAEAAARGKYESDANRSFAPGPAAGITNGSPGLLRRLLKWLAGGNR